MKILLINKYHYKKGGAERAYFDMATILQDAGHEVAFFSMVHPKNEPTPWSSYFVSQVDYQDAQVSFFQKLRSGLRILWNREANKKLSALLDEFQPDIAHAHNIYHQLSPSIFHVLKRRGVPLVLTLHDYKIISPNYNLYANGAPWDHASGFRCVAERCVQGSFVKSSLCALEKWLHSFLRSYQLVDVLISPSVFLARKVHMLGWKGKDIQVVPNPLRSEELTRSLSENEIVPERLVFFGRLSQEKGVDQLIHALAKVPQKELVIIGEGPARETLEMIVKENGLEKRVQFIGAQYGEGLQRELAKAEAIVIPSVWYENLPYTVTESLALGMVVIAAESGGIMERITNGNNGFLYPLGDTEALVRVLQNFEKEDLGRIRKNAKESVQDLQPRVFLEKLETLYRTLV